MSISACDVDAKNGRYPPSAAAVSAFAKVDVKLPNTPEKLVVPLQTGMTDPASKAKGVKVRVQSREKDSDWPPAENVPVEIRFQVGPPPIQTTRLCTLLCPPDSNSVAIAGKNRRRQTRCLGISTRGNGRCFNWSQICRLRH